MIITAAQEVATTEVITSFLPLAAVVIPLLGSFVTYVVGLQSEKLRNFCAVFTSLITVIIVMSMFPLVQHGTVQLQIAKVLQLGIYFRVDMFGFVFAALISIIWFWATLHATAYMEQEHAQNR
ncbi:MAG: NADH dehydrogenase subunit, partial [Firmicutes bacterium]|nr:NADH dehydrogenase subunit [Bacillota bacterium]